jgi:hypothetical protein
MSPLWMSIEPGYDETRLMLTAACVGEALRARLPPLPRQPQALTMLLQALSAWYGEPLSAVVDAGAEGARVHPEQWRRLLGEIDGDAVTVRWVVLPTIAERDRFLAEVGGDFRPASRLVTFAATGKR